MKFQNPRYSDRVLCYLEEVLVLEYSFRALLDPSLIYKEIHFVQNQKLSEKSAQLAIRLYVLHWWLHCRAIYARMR